MWKRGDLPFKSVEMGRQKETAVIQQNGSRQIALNESRKIMGEEKKQIMYVHVYIYIFKGIYLRE